LTAKKGSTQHSIAKSGVPNFFEIFVLYSTLIFQAIPVLRMPDFRQYKKDKTKDLMPGLL